MVHETYKVSDAFVSMFMKKMFSLLLVVLLIMVSCVLPAFAEQPVSLAGSWRISAGEGMDIIDTLIFHEDGTMEAYALLDV